MIRANRREIVEAPLVERDGRYAMDLDALAAALTGRERVLLFCSPHNPGGRVWSRDELRAVADFCAAHDLLLISDEIHHDLVLPGHRAHADAARRAGGPRPAGHADRHHQDLQHRRAP